MRGPALDDLTHTAPPGHSEEAHRVHAWCANCRGWDAELELTAWRTHERTRHDLAKIEGDEDDGDAGAVPVVADVNCETADCPKCGQGDVLMTSTFTATTSSGVHTIGAFSFCFACNAAVDQEANRG